MSKKPYELVDLEQGSPEWLAFRRQHIGASDAPAIMGDSPWKTPFNVWQEKLGIAPETQQSFAMRRGVELEPRARSIYAKVTGEDVKPVVALSTQYPFMMASLDGYGKDHLVEIKHPGKEDHALAKRGIIPKKYRYQLIQALLVLGREEIDYMSCGQDEDDFVILPFSLLSSSEEAGALVVKEAQFWEKVQACEPPELIEKDFVLMDSVEWSLMAGEYVDTKAQMKYLEEKEKRCRERLIGLADGRNAQGGGVRLTQQARRGNVEYNRIPELKGIDLEKYRKGTTSYWKILET